MTQSVRINRELLAQLAGMQFEGERDLYKVLGYERKLTFDKFYERYKRQDIASRIVDAPAAGTWRKPPSLRSENQEFLDAWDDMAKRLKVWRMFERADRLTGIGRYGVILIGVKGNNQLSQPVKKVSDAKSIIYLSAFSEGTAEITEVESNPSNPRFGLPKFYRIKNQVDGKENVSRTLNNVHHSRVIHIAENLLDNEIYGTPRLQPIYNLLHDLEKVVGGSAEMFWLNARQGMQVNIDPETELKAEDAEALQEEVEEYMHQLRRFIRTRGVDIKDLGGNVHDPDGTFQMLMSLVAGTVGIPKRILIGSEQGEMASTQDRANWSEKIQERRNVHAEPNILGAFIDRMQSMGALPEADYDVEWPDLLAASQEEKSIIARRYAQAHKGFADVYGGPLIPKDQAAKFYFEFEAPTTETIDDEGQPRQDDAEPEDL